MIAAGEKGVKFAAARTLNSIAFDALREIPKDAERDLNFRKNAKNALGFRVNKARARRGNSVKTIEAQIWTSRGWVAYHIDEGTREAEQGWVYKGVNYLLVPYSPHKQIFFTVKGRLRAKFRRKLYIIPRSRGALVMHRGKRKRDSGVLVGFLRQRVRYHEDLHYDETVDRLFRQKASRLFKTYLKQEIRRNR